MSNHSPKVSIAPRRLSTVTCTHVPLFRRSHWGEQLSVGYPYVKITQESTAACFSGLCFECGINAKGAQSVVSIHKLFALVLLECVCMFIHPLSVVVSLIYGACYIDVFAWSAPRLGLCPT